MAATKKKSSSRKTKSSSRKGPEKTPAKASKLSKAENRRPAVTPGDLAGAEYNPARTPEGDRVAATGANPRASRAGVLAAIGSHSTEGGSKFELTKVDGGVASFSVDGKEVNLTQADQHALVGLLRQGILETN